MRSGLMLVLNQGRDVLGDFDLLASVITARVRRDQGCTLEDAHPIRAGADGQRARHAGVRNGIVVQVEAHIGRLAGRHGSDLLGRKVIAR